MSVRFNLVAHDENGVVVYTVYHMEATYLPRVGDTFVLTSQTDSPSFTVSEVRFIERIRITVEPIDEYVVDPIPHVILTPKQKPRFERDDPRL